MTFKELLERWEWRPIPHCPGRYVLRTEDTAMPLSTLLGRNEPTQQFTSVAAKDKVLVSPLDEGGIISYARPDGTFVHTLNTEEGFARKLSQLGIRLSSDK